MAAKSILLLSDPDTCDPCKRFNDLLDIYSPGWKDFVHYVTPADGQVYDQLALKYKSSYVPFLVIDDSPIVDEVQYLREMLSALESLGRPVFTLAEVLKKDINLPSVNVDITGKRLILDVEINPKDMIRALIGVAIGINPLDGQIKTWYLSQKLKEAISCI